MNATENTGINLNTYEADKLHGLVRIVKPIRT